MLQLIDIVLRRGERVLFDALNLSIHAGHKAGLVGRNGIGKTTLFELVRRRIQPESGTVLRPASWRLASLEQQVRPSARPALDFVLDGDARLRRIERAIADAERQADDAALAALYVDYEDAGGYDARARGGEILGGLGFAAGDFGKPHRDFSGGWRIRLHLARALMAPSDLLLLDEPTNHLDLEATLWLENWVERYRGTVLMIAHDRDFLDRTAQRIVHLEHGRATVYAGNYSAFERQRAEALARQQAVHKAQRQRSAEIERFVARFRAKASKARQVQSRLRTLAAMRAAAPVHAASPYRFAFTEPAKVSNPTVLLDDAALGYGGARVLDAVTLRVYPSDRIGILGANGAGKTTLLRCLAGQLAPLAGRCEHGRHAAVGYFAQHQFETLDAGRGPLEHLDAAVDMSTQQALDYLGGWGFGGDDARRPAGTFSGGEKARLVLALIAARNPALLILDEPTNHLDLDMRAALAIALQRYQGAVLLVSHDRHLLRACVDEFWLVADGGARRMADGLDAYAALAAARRPKPARKRERRRPGASAKPLQQRQRRVESRIDADSARAARIEQRLEAASMRGCVDELAALAAEHKAVRAQVREAEDEWLRLQEELDRIGEA